MSVYDCRKSPRVSLASHGDAHDYQINALRPLLPQGARHEPVSVAPSLPHCAFPQDVGGVQIARSATHDRAAAADNLLSLIQSANSDRKPPNEQLRRREWPLLYVEQDERHKDVDSTSEDQTSPAIAERHIERSWNDRETRTSLKKGKVGRPAKKALFEEHIKRTKRDKKPTYIVRKEKKALLEIELLALKHQIIRLRKSSESADTSFLEKVHLQAKVDANELLRAEVQKQDVQLRNVCSICTVEYLMKRSKSPLESVIHLTTNLNQRRAVLVGLKDRKLRQANNFIRERLKVLPQVTPWCEESKFETLDGHYVAEKMDNTLFHGVRSVRQVFEALQISFRNTEASVLENLGDITVRQGDERTASTSFSNCRLVSMMSHGVKIEQNVVKFFNLVDSDVVADDDEKGPYGVFAINSVDVDDLYPYVPHERIRMDIDAAMKLTEHFCRRPPNRKTQTRTRHPLYGNGGFPYPLDPDENKDSELERVVVLTRYFWVKLHHTEMDIPPHILQEARHGLACLSDAMIKSMHRAIYES
ncbi:hypothetical protein CCR75_009347 [Bremia lactucae]|uniref:Uncharacterized protein n=1 Tax=Bremia lactucae TaxID=4779 RepID=A0A976IH79_BRELC|nr:hypothetical protein CCR75_009347 [Bremia lactucae]